MVIRPTFPSTKVRKHYCQIAVLKLQSRFDKRSRGLILNELPLCPMTSYIDERSSTQYIEAR